MSHHQSPVQLACREDQREVTAKRRSVYDSMTSTSMGASGRCRLPAAVDNPCPPDDTNALGYSQQLANVRTTDLPTLRLQATTHESVTTVSASHVRNGRERI